MKRELGATCNFLLVYVREAHASDEWHMERNEKDGVSLSQPVTEDERCGAALACTVDLAITIPCVVDGMDDAVSRTWGAWPERLYVLDEKGVVAYQGGMGPFGFHPEEVEACVRERWMTR